MNKRIGARDVKVSLKESKMCLGWRLLLAGVAVMLFLVGCPNESKKTELENAGKIRPEGRVSGGLAEKVWYSLLARLKRVEISDIPKEIGSIAMDELLSKKDSLRLRAEMVLSIYPKCSGINRTDYDIVLLVSPENNNLYQRKETVLDWGSSMWDPVWAAYTYQAIAWGKKCDLEEVNKRLVIRAQLSGWQMPEVMDESPDHPCILLRNGPEICIVSLVVIGNGLYKLQGLEWLQRKDRPVQQRPVQKP